jgi:general secretion pathway protein G
MSSSGPTVLQRPGLITFLAVLHFLTGALMLLLTVVTIATLKDKNPIPAPFALLFIVGTALSFFTGVGLLKLKDYGRVLQIIFAAFGLLLFPVGTLISVLLLIYFNKPGVKLLFSGKTARELTPEDYAALQGVTNSGTVVAVVAICLVVGVAMMGILAAIAIPNLLTAMQRSKQKRTMADMRQIASAIEKYRETNNKLPEGASLADISNAIKTNVIVDGWNHGFRYAADGKNYWVVSAGKDGLFETEKVEEYVQSKTTNFDADIVLENAGFLRVPEGVQR